jgi:hypothetical protein
MTSQIAMTAMSVAEFCFWVLLGLLFWKKDLHHRFPAMGFYLALRVISTPALMAVLYAQSQPWGHGYYVVYFCSYWAVYLASALLLFFICMEIFRSALSALPGLMKIGIMIFRWVVLVSVIVTFSSISFMHKGLLTVPDVVSGLMRSVGILELCLLAFLCLSMNALRLSIRDISFGLALGFGLMATDDFIAALIMTSHRLTLTASAQFVYEGVILVSLGIWVVYCALPEPARKPVVMSANSAIYRWNEIASALGHPGTQVAVQQPANSFFLTDVEDVVEKVISRNLKDRKSES